MRPHHMTRPIEGLMIVFMIMLGLVIGYNPASLSDPIYSVMLSWAPPQGWSGTIGGIGIVHFVAWWHNGHGMWWTGPLRAAGCSAAAILFGIMSLGAFLSVGASPATIGYAVAFIAAMQAAVANVIRFLDYRGLLTGAVMK